MVIVSVGLHCDILYQILETIQHIQLAAGNAEIRADCLEIFAQRAFFQAREVEAVHVFE